MNRLTSEKRVQTVAAIGECNSINTAARMTGVAKHTFIKLPEDLEVLVPLMTGDMAIFAESTRHCS